MGKSLNGKELGTGITQRKDGLYQARFIDRFGERETLYARTYTEIVKKLRDKQYEDEKMLNVVHSKMTLDEWFDIWITTYKKHCRDTTIRSYKTSYNRIKDEIGWRKLSKLNLVVLQQAFNNLKTDESRANCKAVLVDILNCAVASDLLNKNIATAIKVKINNNEFKERRVLTESEVETLLSMTQDSSLYPFFVVALGTGMRMGEILALTWDCIDFDNGIIKVNKTLSYLPNNGNAIYEFHPTKTSAGKRNIPMSKKVVEVLYRQKERCENINRKYQSTPGFESLVFISKRNRPLHESNIRKSIIDLVNRMNAQNPDLNFEVFSPHCLRHTFATNCIQKGMNPKVLQKILGHTTLQMTMDIYCHVFDETIWKEMSLIDEMV